MYALETKAMCKRVERICQVDPEGWYAPVIGEELVRCKDCKLWMKNPYRESSVFGLCFKHKDIAIATDETDWCSWAERKTDD